MAEENNGPSPEELRRRIQERLEKMKQSESDSSKEEKKPAEPENKPEPEEKIEKTPEPPKAEEKVIEKPVAEESEAVVEETPEPVKEEEKEAPVTEEIKSEAQVEEPAPESKPEPKVEKPVERVMKKEEKSKPEKKSTPKSESTKTRVMEEKGEKKGKGGLITLLIVLLVAVVGLFAWKYYDSSKKGQIIEQQTQEIDNLSAQRDKIKKDLESLQSDYSKLNTDNEQLSAELEAKNQQLEKALSELKKSDLNQKELAYLRRQVFQLKQGKEEFQAKLDSLTQANVVLTEENQIVKSQLEETKTSNDQLSAQVTQGKKLKGLNLKVSMYNIKGKETDKAKKVDEIETCITLIENPIAEAGEKNIFLRIVSPTGDILVSSKDNIFEAEGIELAYSAVGSIFYQNKTVESCIKYSPAEGEVAPGFYDIEIFTDGEMIGSTNIEIK